MSTEKILYLLGAGATHAEIMNLEDSPSEKYVKEKGLLISHVSRRVMERAHKNDWFKENEEILASKQGSFNIELYISLLETNKPPEEDVTSLLRELVRKDIESVLTKNRISKFYLHKGLLELHKIVESQENLLGFITLNYDAVLDEAYREIYKTDPEYCLTSKYGEPCPVLKLHGSFNWTEKQIYGRSEKIPIIPLGVNKNYLTPPYNFIWGRAYELLIKCDILRVLGCSMSQSDVGLIDLIFKAHKQRHASFEIQIIDFQPSDGHHQIRNNFGFLPNIVDPIKIEKSLIDDRLIYDPRAGNPFKIWLRAKALKMAEAKISRTKYLKRLLA